jgi:hypothetical protein
MEVFLTCTQRATLKALLDQIIPNKNNMPSAGEISTGYIESSVLVSAHNAHVVLDILKAIHTMSDARHSKPFSSLVDSAKKSALAMVENKEPDLFNAFVRLAYSGYYTNASVIKRLGPNARKPQPEGFPIAPFDPTIVKNVRDLGPRYRET